MSGTEPNLVTLSEIAKALAVNPSVLSNWRNPKPPRKPRVNPAGETFPTAKRSERVGQRSREYFDLAEVKAWVDSIRPRDSRKARFRIDAPGVVANAAVSLGDVADGLNPVDQLASLAALSAIAARAGIDDPSLEDALEAASDDPTCSGITWGLAGSDGEAAAFKLMAVPQALTAITASELFDAALETREWNLDHRTPAEVVRLAGLIASTDRRARSVLDVAAGSCGLLCSVGSELGVHGGLHLAAQDLDSVALNNGRKRAALEGVELEAALATDSLDDQAPGASVFDVVLADPPLPGGRDFGRKGGPGLHGAVPAGPGQMDLAPLPNHGEWALPTPPERDDAVAWLELALAKTAAGGRAIALLQADSTSQRGRFAEVRARLVATGQLEAVIALPGRLRRSSRVAQVLWVLRNRVGGDPELVREPLLIDARGARMRPAPRSIERSTWPVEVARIFETWITTGELIQSDGVNAVTVAPTEFIGDADMNLDPAVRFRPVFSRDEVQAAAAELEAFPRVLDGAADALSAVTRSIPPLDDLGGIELRWTTLGELEASGLIDVIPGVRRIPPAAEADSDAAVATISPGDLGLSSVDSRAADAPSHVAMPDDRSVRSITCPGDVVFLRNPMPPIAQVERVGGRLALGSFVTICRLTGHSDEASGLLPEMLAYFIGSGRNQRQASAGSGRNRYAHIEVPMLSGSGAQRLFDWVKARNAAHAAGRDLGDAVSRADAAFDLVIAAASQA